jgi:hypothetical protein
MRRSSSKLPTMLRAANQGGTHGHGVRVQS